MGNLDDMLANAGLGGDADDYSAPEGFRSGFVSIVGRPNTGKSTLTNSLVGEKIAITANQPETTRHPVRGVVHRENCQIVVVDTPGLHKPRTLLGERLNDMVQETYSDVDLVAMVVPADEKIGPGDRWIYENVSKGCKNIMGIVSKVDKVSRDTIIERLIELQELLGPDAELVPLSSKSGENINTLIDVMASQLPEGPRLYPKGHITDEDLHTRMAEQSSSARRPSAVCAMSCRIPWQSRLMRCCRTRTAKASWMSTPLSMSSVRGRSPSSWGATVDAWAPPFIRLVRNSLRCSVRMFTLTCG